MGGDGGSLNNSRMEHVNMRSQVLGTAAAKPDQSVSQANRDQWTLCSLSRLPLQTPVVACRLGRLYNKDALIQHLLAVKLAAKNNDHVDSGNIGSQAKHIRSLKDVKECNVMMIVSDSNAKIETQRAAAFRCPISMQDAIGGIKFIVNWACGCVLSEKAMKQTASQPLKYTDSNLSPLVPSCPVCNNPAGESVTLYPSSTELEAIKVKLKQDMEHRNALKDKKRKNKEKEKEKEKGKEPVPHTEKDAKLLEQDQQTQKKHKHAKHTHHTHHTHYIHNSNHDDKSKSQVYASLFLQKDNNKKGINPNGSFTGVSLRPAGN